MTRKPIPPSYDLYGGNDARVSIDGQSIHPDNYGSEKSHRADRELLATASTRQRNEKCAAGELPGVTVLRKTQARRWLLKWHIVLGQRNWNRRNCAQVPGVTA